MSGTSITTRSPTLSTSTSSDCDGSWICRANHLSFGRVAPRVISWPSMTNGHETIPTTLTLRARLTWWYGLVLVVVLGVSGVAVVWMNGRLGVNRVDGQLADVEATVLKILTNELR